MPRLGSSPVLISSVIDAEAKEVLRCFPETIMATALLDANMGSCTDVVWRSGREEFLGFLETMLSAKKLLRLTREKNVASLLSSSHKKGRETRSWTAVDRTSS